MALTQKFELRQSQSLVMTPQLLQAIKLLQLSNLDLTAYVDAELESNPLLERDDEREPVIERAATGGETGVERSASDTVPPDGAPEPAGDEAREVVTDDGAIHERMDADLANEFPDDHDKPADETRPELPAESWSAPERPTLGDSQYNLEAFVAGDATLAEHLAEQLGLITDDPALRLIGGAIINELDENGYLRADTGALAERLGSDHDEVERALAMIQTLEPTGVGARDLAECLKLQLRERDRLDPAMATLLAHLDLVARRDFAALRRLCNVDDDDLADMIREVRALDPKPGSAFSASAVQIVVPDVLVRPGPHGNWLIELNQETLPRLLVSRDYAASVNGRSSGGADERTYLTDCLQSANWLIRSLDQRAQTILKVTTEIVRQQDAFLMHGVQHLRPLNLRDVADAVGLHESTVSRATSNKYMATNRGTFELKYFFTAAIQATGAGEAHSAEAVRDRIRRLIDDESPKAVLSDDAIVRELGDQGIEIARRTVAKYRESMRIPSSVQRRREKAAAL